METNFNLGSLKVVKSYLEEYIQKSIENIQQNISIISVEKKQPEDYTSIELLDKVSKTLDIIGLKGISKVFSICQDGIVYVKSGKSNMQNSLDILQNVKQVLEKATIYINKIINSGFDQPTKLFSDYKLLAELIDERVSIKDLFYPKLDIKPTFNKEIQKDLKFGVFINDNIKKYIKNKLNDIGDSLRVSIPNLVNEIKNGNISNHEKINTINELCHQIYEDLDFLQKIKINKNSYIFFGLSKLYICCLSPKFNGNIARYSNENQKYIFNTLQNMLSTVDNLSIFIENSKTGDKTASFVLNDNYIQDLLFEMKIINDNNELKEMPVFKKVEEFFDLNYYLSQINEASAFINFNEDDSLLLDEINSVFLKVKSIAEHSINSYELNDGNLNEVSNYLKELSSYLDNYEKVKKLSNEILLFIENKVLSNKEIEIKFKKELSLGIILLEHGVKNYINETVDPRNLLNFEEQIEIQVARFKAFKNDIVDLPIPQIGADNGLNDLKEVFEDYSKKLRNVEESLDYFLKNNGENIDELKYLPNVLNEIKGIFLSIDKKETIKVIDFILNPWKEIIEKNSFDVNMVELKDSIEFLGGISLLVKSFSDGNTVEAEEIYENIVSKFQNLHLIENNQTIDDAIFNYKDVESGVNFDKMYDDSEDANKTNFSEVEHMQVEKNEENIINNLSDGNWPLLKELETTRFALKNKKKRDNINNNIEPSIENVVLEVNGVNNDNDLSEQKVNDQLESNLNLLNDNLIDSKVEVLENVNHEETFTDNNTKEESYEISWVSDSTNDPELAEIFLIEAEEVFQNLNQEFDKLSSDINDKDALTNTRRFYHTLKGSGRMVGLKHMGEVAWMVEQTLNRCLSEDLTFNQDVLDAVIEIKEKFQEWVGDLQINNLVNLDIIDIKKRLLKINPEIQNSFDLGLEEAIKNENLSSIEEETIESKQDLKEIELIESNEEETKQESDIVLVNTLVENNSNIMEEPLISDVEIEKTEIEEEILIEKDVVVDTIAIDNIQITLQSYEVFNTQSDVMINTLKEIINSSFDEPILLGQGFSDVSKELALLCDSVGLIKITKLVNLLGSVSDTANNLNIGLSQASLSKLRHVIDNLEIFKSTDASEHIAFYESLKEILIDLEKEILDFEISDNSKENILEEEEIDMEKLAQIKLELQEEMKAILEEKNSLLQTMVEKLENSQEENRVLIEKISNLEENLENFKSNQEQKEKMFIKALEVNRNDIKVLVDLIKKM